MSQGPSRTILNRCWRAACVLAFWPLSAPAQGVPQPDREAIAAEAEALWNGLAHIEAKGSQTYRSLGVTFGFELDFTNDGRSRIRNWKETNDHRSWTGGTIRDGQREIYLQIFPHHPDVAHDARLRPQEGDPTSYVGPMNSFLWAWLPCGKPLHRLIADGAELNFVDDAGNLLEVRTSYRDNPVTIVVDRRKEWLPRTVAFDDGGPDLEVTDYGRDRGRWLPVAGRQSSPTDEDGRRTRSTFQLTEYHVNRPIIDSDDALPDLPPGARVRDEIEGTSSIIGTQADRIPLFLRYDPQALVPGE